MNTVLFRIVIDGLQLELRQSRSSNAGFRFTSVLTEVANPDAIGITYLGDDRYWAWYDFARKIACHRRMGESRDGG